MTRLLLCISGGRNSYGTAFKTSPIVLTRCIGVEASCSFGGRPVLRSKSIREGRWRRVLFEVRRGSMMVVLTK